MRVEAPIFFVKKKINPKQLWFLRLYECPQMHQSTSRTPPTRGPSMGAILNNSLFLRLYKSVNKCTNPLVKHLPCVDNTCMQSRTTPCFRALRVGWRLHQSSSQHVGGGRHCGPNRLTIPKSTMIFKASALWADAFYKS